MHALLPNRSSGYPSLESNDQTRQMSTRRLAPPGSGADTIKVILQTHYIILAEIPRALYLDKNKQLGAARILYPMSGVDRDVDRLARAQDNLLIVQGEFGLAL